MSAEDLPRLYGLMRQLNPTMTLGEFEQNYAQVRDDGYKLYAAVTEPDNVPVGLVGYLFNRDLCVGRAMYIDILVVDKNHRRQGIAQKLLNFVLSKLHQDKNARCVRWTTRNDLNEAIAFYKNKVQPPIGYYYRIDNPYFNR